MWELLVKVWIGKSATVRQRRLEKWAFDVCIGRGGQEE